MQNSNSLEPIEALLRQVEVCLHRRLLTASDFEWASVVIDRRTHARLSRTTLMRLWGYVREPVAPRQATLSILAQCCGYADWPAFVEQLPQLGQRESAPALGDRIDVSVDLRPGQQVRFTWLPDLVMDARYCGDGRWEVVHSVGTRLVAGSTFTCFLAISHEPLMLSQVLIAGQDVGAYVCGRVNGVHFEWSPQVSSERS